MAPTPEDRVLTPGNDNGLPPDAPALLAAFWGALALYSRLPLPTEVATGRPDLNRIAAVVPVASLVIGLGPALVLMSLGLAGWPAYFAAALAVVAQVLVTGAMAEDGFGDSCDGLFGGQSVERRLEIFKDSRLGTYGVTGIALLLVLRVTALGGVAAANPVAAALIMLGAGILARSGALYLAHALPPARADGLSASAGQVARLPLMAGGGLALGLALVLVWPATGLVSFVLGVALMAATGFAWVRLCRVKLGGQTGDVIGGMQALLEIAALTAFIL